MTTIRDIFSKKIIPNNKLNYSNSMEILIYLNITMIILV
jgi:hypothetical protein